MQQGQSLPKFSRLVAVLHNKRHETLYMCAVNVTKTYQKILAVTVAQVQQTGSY